MFCSKHSPTAPYSPPTYTLTVVSNPSTGGKVSLSPAGGTYDSGTVVTLTATPSSGYSFSDWGLSASGTNATTQLIMTGNMNVTANFSVVEQHSYTLTVVTSPSAGGTVSLSPSGGTYASGTVVTLTASPASGYNFSSWSGNASGTSTTTQVTMLGNMNVTANFSTVTVKNYTLTVTASPTAGGTVSFSRQFWYVRLWHSSNVNRKSFFWLLLFQLERQCFGNRGHNSNYYDW